MKQFMYKIACKYSDDIVFYFDFAGNKYVARGGTVAWRINNPGLVPWHFLPSREYGSIGTFRPYAIFSHPQNGHRALNAWLHSKKYLNSTLYGLAQYYQPDSIEMFVRTLTSLSEISPERKIKDLQQQEFDRLLVSLEKLCGYAPIGNESFLLLPKIVGKIEKRNEGDSYIIDGNIVLSKDEAIAWIQSHRLDGVVVHEKDGSVYLRSRPNHCIQHLNGRASELSPYEENIDSLVRVVGEQRPGQCIWAFINGILNTKDGALESAKKISQMASGEQVYSMPNDTYLHGFKDFLVCVALKLTIDTPIVQWAVKFFRYLLTQSEREHFPVIVFVHSQGAIITEHALEVLTQKEREQLIIFTFGGGSFIAPGKAHPDSHNFASSADPICRALSPNLQFLALQRYFGSKEGLNEQEVIRQLALTDAMFDLDTVDTKAIAVYTNQRIRHYEKEFFKIRNVTILDPDPHHLHKFCSSCYQVAIQKIVKKYQHL